MRAHKRKKFISLFLAFCMIVSMLPVTAMAQEPEEPGSVLQICTHHTEHTVECGYAEAVASSSCTHQCSGESGCALASCAHAEHDETCGYAATTDGTPCAHKHDESCGYAAATEGIPCTHQCNEETGCTADGCTHSHNETCGYVAATDGTPCTHSHDVGCGYSEPTAEVACSHRCGGETGCVIAVCAHETHDETCGYVEGSEGSPCTFVCEECTQQIVYSNQALRFSGGSLSEPDGSREVTLTRSGDTDSSLSATILVYDYSANYGEDYQIHYDDALVQKNEGATSIYDAFRDHGQLTSGMLFDLSAAMAQVESLQNGEVQEDVSAADMLDQLDDLGVQAAAIPVIFGAGQSEVSLTVEVLDDSASEYEETFFLVVLDAEGEAVETAQLVCAITDDDAAPSAAVSFDCEEELELDLESGEAELVFKRTGDLATTTLAALCLNGEPMGWVDFAPWQETQTVWVIEAGTYTLLDDAGLPVEGAQVEVYDNRPAETAVPEGADPVLDAVPESYAAMRPNRQAISTSWLPSWATGGSYSNENEIVVMGSTSKNIFKAGGNTSKGSVDFFVDGKNVHNIDTSGTGSRLSTGYLFADGTYSHDVTGIESVTGVAYTTGVDGEADICIGFSGGYRYTQRITSGGTYTLTEVFPDKFQKTGYVYYGNTDPNKGSGGINMYVPNGYKFDLRQYRFVIEDSSEFVTPLNYTGGTDPGDKVPQINSSKKYQMMTINSQTYGANKTVDIVYSCDSQYPARLVGYKLRNYKTGTTSGVISLTDGGDGSGGSASFTFDADFLKKYESTYCAETSVNGVEAWTFQVIPVYEKIPVDSTTILSATEGTIQLVDTGTLYRGDIAVFEDTATDSTLSGVWYQAKTATGDTIKEQAVSQTRYGSATNRFQVSLLYNRYTFQGVYSADAAQLLVYYADGASAWGKLDNTPGQIVSPTEYVVGDYVSLVAKANSGYVTRWNVAGTYYYGDVFYYQLDGNPDHNKITVDFVSASTTANTLSGTLLVADVELRTGGSSYLPMANTEISITADKTYTATTDENGDFSISGFTGVNDAVYSAAVKYENAIGYTTFTYRSGTALELKMPQFAVGVPYPEKVSANVDGGGSSQNMLTLTSNGTLSATVRVYVPPKGYTITGVNVYFLNPDLVSEGATVQATAFPAAYSATSGDYQEWTVSVSAGQLTSGTQLYVSVEADKVIYVNGAATTTSISSGLVNGGYQLTTPNVDTSVTVLYDVPETPGLQNAPSIDLSKLNIPVLGNLDFSLSSKTGGFFTQRTDANGNLTLICGSTYLADFATGPVSEKYAAKQKTKAALEAKKNSTDPADQPVGGANPGVAAATPGEAQTGNGSASNKAKKDSNWAFSPAFLFKITLSPGTEDATQTYISRYEMALGIDAFYKRNIPFSVYGVPLYICLTFTTEAYGDLQVAFKDDKLTLDDLSDALYALCEDADGVIESADSFIAAPAMQFGAKGGVGYNGFLSMFLEAIVSAPFIISVTPTIDAAAQLSFTVNAGADLVVFTGKVGETLNLDAFGNEELIWDLKTITGLAAADTASTMSLRSSAGSEETGETQTPDIETMLNEMTFSAMPRTAGLRRGGAADGTVKAGAFKNTGVHLLQLDDDTVMAFFLQDTAAPGSDTLNYLTAAYSISVDGGKTWDNTSYVSDNTDTPNTSLQFDINLFQLQDRTLVTWSEANFDEVLKNLGDINVTQLTPAQISKFMNAMNLKGRFFKSDGTPMGEAFTIAENSTVACGALDAVQNGDMVYVYYQRNVFPTDESNETVTLADLLATERTVALARANVNDTSSWTSTSVRAMNENGQEYRITDVEPFVHDGVMGEILVLDRDGKLAEWNGDSWDLSNEDRQLYLRTYDFDTDGTPVPTALMAFTDPDACAQSPEIVSNDPYLHLFWNQNGKVVYVSDFVATANDHEDIQKAAYVLKGSDGAVTTQNEGEFTVNDIASDESFHVGTTFTASMDESGNVLLSWIASDTEDTSLLPTDEIYGVVLETITNAKAADRSSGELTEGNKNLYQLYAQGAPVALTDEDSLIGALDSLFLSGNNFLLAFSQLNNTMRSEATAANIRAVQSVYQPELEIESVSAPEYPMPGSEMTVVVTVTNKGLGTAENVSVTASGVGSGAAGTIRSIQPGRSETVELIVTVPESFGESAELTVTAEVDESSDSDYVDILYGPYFVLDSMPAMANIGGTKDYQTETLVYNAGNAAGVPTLTFANDLFAVDDTAKTYTYTSEESVALGGTALLTYVLENTLVNEGQTGTLTVSVGDGADQRIQGQMPKLMAHMTMSDISTSEPDDPDDSDSPGSSTSGGSAASPTYPPIVENAENGEVTVSPKRPEKGDKVTITPEPDTGYEVGEIFVTDKNGNEIDITDNGNGTYSFQQPSGKVEIKVTFVPANADSSSIVFSDVAADAYYADAVQWAVENGVTSGTSATTFSPNAACTRAQAVTFLWRSAGSPESENRVMVFTDVAADAYYYDAVQWAVEQGITSGTSATTFSPNAKCTRAQIVTFLWRSEQSLAVDGASPFVDVAANAYYADAVQWAVEEGITAGTTATTFSPNDSCTRAQIVTFLYRCCN